MSYRELVALKGTDGLDLYVEEGVVGTLRDRRKDEVKRGVVLRDRGANTPMKDGRREIVVEILPSSTTDKTSPDIKVVTCITDRIPLPSYLGTNLTYSLSFKTLY